MFKLVRDKIPDIMREKGQPCQIHVASDEEFLCRLTDKLREEVEEFIENPSPEEMGDILEVMHNLCKIHGFKMTDVSQSRLHKKKKCGNFKKKYILTLNHKDCP